MAELFDVSVPFVYANWRALGGRKLGTGRNAPMRFLFDDVLEATTPTLLRTFRSTVWMLSSPSIHRSRGYSAADDLRISRPA
jgi:hypothetical protein